MLRYLFFAVSMLLAALLPASAAVPVVRSFSRTEYGGGAQNWAVAQDSLGRMYFGNREGLLMYNSAEWMLRRVPNFSTVRSIFIDPSNERIYVGASDDFGYFELNRHDAGMNYVSLLPSVPEQSRGFSEIWNIHREKSIFWFQSDFAIFRYDGKNSIVIPFSDKITTSALIGGRLYAGLLKQGLVVVNDRKVTPVAGTELLLDKRIIAILPGPKGGLLIVTDFSGLFEVRDGAVSPYLHPVSDFLRRNQAFCATFNPRTRQYAFGSVNAGAIILNPDGSTSAVSMASGMQNNTVLNLAFDRQGNLWLALDNGIDFAITNSAIHPLPFPGATYGAGYTSLLRGPNLFLGTNRGLYAFEYPYPSAMSTEPERLPLIKGQIWAMDTVGSGILVSGDAGLFASPSGSASFSQIPGINGAWCGKAVPGHQGKAIASTYNGFVLLSLSPAGWTVSHRITGSKDAAGRFYFDGAGNIWIAHWMRGIYRLTLNDSLTAFTRETLFNSSHGLPSDRNNIISFVDGHLVFSTENGFYRFNEKTGRFVPYERYNEIFASHQSARLYQSGGEVWSVSPDNVWRATMAPAGGYDVDTTTFQSLGSKLIPGFDNLEFISGRRALMASQDGFYEVAIDYVDPSPSRPGLFVTRVIANGDSTVYIAPLAPQTQKIEVPYALNSLRFEFVTPEYRAHNAVTYSYCLEGYDESWTPWTSNNSKEYTQLREGSYTLRIRSFDSFTGLMDQTELQFRIRPPWYRSLPALILYILLLAAAGWGMYVLWLRNNRRLAMKVEKEKEQEMQRMKQQASEEALRKDYEIASLKTLQLEHDFKHKSEELSNITMNVIRKNEILLDISSKLDKLRRSLPADTDAETSKQFAHIRNLIQENISHDDDWRNFTRNFDIVYENYTKRLLELHPDLNSSDLRICCYLKMGLSSKEIAPLFNISYRSVEMTRYRLRKKMNLSRETNLTDYLQKI